ncbi:hypothetical protein [Streptomyces sp. NPDC007355]|uniref:hypothetical protein n=1 Tax=Streptomyces sp. NPDC007355 TaxID=3364778 RepID=UPI0036BE72A0
MADRPARTYLVTNPTALFGPGRRIEFASSRPAGAVVSVVVDGRRVHALFTDIPLNDGMFAAELQVTYL